MAKSLVIGNWKLNPETIQEARSLAVKIEQGLLNVKRANVETVICPPFVFLSAVQPSLHFAKLGAQDISHETKGAFTGEISGKQLKEFGVEYVIVGHSERRNLGEDDKLINAKIRSAVKAGLHPILCVGHGTKRNDSENKIKNVIKAQLKKGLKGVRGKMVIAYEPVWAISKGLGTGKVATPEHAAEIIEFIKSQTERARVIYGGSVDGKNSEAFAAQKHIDGALVGGASLVPAEFLGIVKAFS